MAYATVRPAGLWTIRREDLDLFAGSPRRPRTREDAGAVGSVPSRTLQLLREAFRPSAGAADRGLNPELKGR